MNQSREQTHAIPPDPVAIAEAARSVLAEAASLRAGTMVVLDRLIHHLTVQIAAHARPDTNMGGNLDAVMPAVRDLDHVLSVMRTMLAAPRPGLPVRGEPAHGGRGRPGWYTHGNEQLWWDGSRWWQCRTDRPAGPPPAR